MSRWAALEPGIIPAFRLFTVIRLTILVVNAGMDLAFNRWGSPQLLMFLISLGDILFLLGYLSWNRLQGTLKTWYLPLGIILATVGPILEQYAAIRISLDLSDRGLFFAGAWQSVLVLFIPLFIISWQYSMRQVVLFSVATFLVDGVSIFLLGRQVLVSAVAFPVFGMLLSRAFLTLFIGYMAVNLMKTQRGLRRELSEANLRLARYAGTLEHLAVSRERNRLARELHDILAHTLSGVAVELEAVKATWNSDPAQAAAMLDRSLQSTRGGLTETRRAMQALRASPLEDQGLALAVRGLAESSAGRAGLTLEIDIAERLLELPPEVEQTAYRVAEEALRNAVAHAGARTLQVALQAGEGRLDLLVSDDGQGFDPNTVDPFSHFGLAGMRERAEAVGGRLEIQSRAGGGTQVRLVYGGEA